MNFSSDDLNKAWRVKATIEQEYHKSYSVEELANQVGTNKSTLNFLFRKITKMPVKHYLLWFRIEKAKELLTTTNYTINYIAGKVGISRRNFERQFKKLVKMTPNEWRNKQEPEWQNYNQEKDNNNNISA